MPLYEYRCDKCGRIKERIFSTEVLFLSKRCDCGGTMGKIFPTKPPSFKLVYDNKNDICDWDGNTSRYWEEYNKQKAEGKNVRIPELDGDAT